MKTKAPKARIAALALLAGLALGGMGAGIVHIAFGNQKDEGAETHHEGNKRVFPEALIAPVARRTQETQAREAGVANDLANDLAIAKESSFSSAQKGARRGAKEVRTERDAAGFEAALTGDEPRAKAPRLPPAFERARLATSLSPSAPNTLATRGASHPWNGAG